MKTVTITVQEGIVSHNITISYSGDVIPTILDSFIVEHLGGRPDDRKK